MAYLEQFDPEAEIWLFDNRALEHWVPGEPHGQYDYEEHKDVVMIPFGYSDSGN